MSGPVRCDCGACYKSIYPFFHEGRWHTFADCSKTKMVVETRPAEPPRLLSEILFPDQDLHKDAGKPAIELIPPTFLWEMGKVMEFGAKKYSRDGWRQKGGMEWRRLFGSLLRHSIAAAMGEDKDPDSGYLHLAHAACDAAMLADYLWSGLGKDDRITYTKKEG